MGAKETEAKTILEKRLKSVENLNFDNTVQVDSYLESTTPTFVQLAIGTLQTTLGMDLKPSGIEVGIVSRDSPKCAFCLALVSPGSGSAQ